MVRVKDATYIIHNELLLCIYNKLSLLPNLMIDIKIFCIYDKLYTLILICVTGFCDQRTRVAATMADSVSKESATVLVQVSESSTLQMLHI
jgi:hypothetical protein